MIRSSAKKTSCSERSCRRLSKLWYLLFNFEKPITRSMREVRSWGKDGSVTMFLTARCGSAVMRQMLREGEELREWGMLIFPGFKRFLSTTCFLVVRTSQTASLWSGAPSSSSSLSPIRVFLVAFFSSSSCFDLMCRRRADDALLTYREGKKKG